MKNVLIVMLILLFCCTIDLSEYHWEYENTSNLYDKTQEELYEAIRKRYTDPPDPPAENLHFTKEQLDQIRENGLGSNKCVTCNYQGDDPNMY